MEDQFSTRPKAEAIQADMVALSDAEAHQANQRSTSAPLSKYADPSIDDPDPAPSENTAGSLSDPFCEALAALRQEVAEGLLYTHSRANNNTSRLLESTSFLYAVIELLVEKGIITIEELDARKTVVAKRVEKRFLDKDMGVNLQDPEQDKYAFSGDVEIDCESRVHLCQSACCRFWFPLSRQDVDEGVVQWDFRFPYIINQGEKGYCQQMDRDTCGCTIYEQRPLPCRAFDCRGDKRIWLDFENRVINPDLESIFPSNDTKPIELELK